MLDPSPKFHVYANAPFELLLNEKLAGNTQVSNCSASKEAFGTGFTAIELTTLSSQPYVFETCQLNIIASHQYCV